MIEAVPLAAAEVTVKLGAEAPSLVSLKLRVPVMVTSSAAEPDVCPPKEPASLTAVTEVVRVSASEEKEVELPLEETSISSPTEGVGA